MNKKAIILFSILLPFFLLLLSYKVIYASSTYTQDQQQSIDFLNNKGQLQENYTKLEASHMQDVKEVMSNINIAFYLLLIILTLTVTYYKKDKKIYQLFKVGGLTTLISIGIFLLLLIIAFQPLFTLFHAIFFPQGNWIFPVDSFIITTFPIEFFIAMALKITLLTIFLAIIFIVLGKLLKR